MASPRSVCQSNYRYLRSESYNLFALLTYAQYKRGSVTHYANLAVDSEVLSDSFHLSLHVDQHFGQSP
ncbi:hypothetical protein BDD12DRAFT_825330, partial [Trichophaea hybrida]